MLNWTQVSWERRCWVFSLPHLWVNYVVKVSLILLQLQLEQSTDTTTFPSSTARQTTTISTQINRNEHLPEILHCSYCLTLELSWSSSSCFASPLSSWYRSRCWCREPLACNIRKGFLRVVALLLKEVWRDCWQLISIRTSDQSRVLKSLSNMLL